MFYYPASARSRKLPICNILLDIGFNYVKHNDNLHKSKISSISSHKELVQTTLLVSTCGAKSKGEETFSFIRKQKKSCYFLSFVLDLWMVICHNDVTVRMFTSQKFHRWRRQQLIFIQNCKISAHNSTVKWQRKPASYDIDLSILGHYCNLTWIASFQRKDWW